MMHRSRRTKRGKNKPIKEAGEVQEVEGEAEAEVVVGLGVVGAGEVEEGFSLTLL